MFGPRRDPRRTFGSETPLVGEWGLTLRFGRLALCFGRLAIVAAAAWRSASPACCWASPRWVSATAPATIAEHQTDHGRREEAPQPPPVRRSWCSPADCLATLASRNDRSGAVGWIKPRPARSMTSWSRAPAYRSSSDRPAAPQSRAACVRWACTLSESRSSSSHARQARPLADQGLVGDFDGMLVRDHQPPQ